MRTSGATSPPPAYLPYYRRLLLRALAVWLVLRLFTEGARHALDRQLDVPVGGDGLHPLAALALIAFVLSVLRVYDRIMREWLFRLNAGIATRTMLLAAGAFLLALELTLRALS